MRRGKRVMRVVKFVLAGLAVSIGLPAQDVDRGIELYEAKKYAEAESALRDVTNAEPDNARAQQYLGLSLLRQNKLSEAEAPLKKAEELSPDSDEVKVGLGRVYLGQKKYEKAESVLQEAIEKKPENAYAHYYAGMAYNGMKRPDRMVERFETFLKLAPDAPEAPKVRSLLRSVR